MAMDVIFRVHEQEFISDAVEFGTFLIESVEERDRSFILVGEDGARKSNFNFQHFASFAGIDEQTAENVFEIIDVEKLKSAHVHYNFHVAEPTPTAVLPASWHKTLGYLKKEHKKKRNPQYKSVANRLLKYDRVELSLLTVPKFDHLTDCEGTECIKIHRDARLNAAATEGCDRSWKDIETVRDEIIVTCSIYYGYSRPLQYDERRLGRLMKVTDKLQLLGSSTLLDLKNSFQCPSDISFAEDMSMSLPHPDHLAKHRFPNSFFFIHDTFYVDDSVNIDAWLDLSETIREWAKNKEFIGEMKMGFMSQTRLLDLKARLGMPYLYVHQGQCEHLICFTDLKLWESRDMPHSYYPIKMQEKIFRRVCCIGCKMSTAEWVVIDSDRLPFTPAFVCHSCYEEFNFTKEGHKIGDFKAVPYCDRKAMDKSSTLFIQKLLQICKKMEKGIMANQAALFYPFEGQLDVKPDKKEINSIGCKDVKTKKEIGDEIVERPMKEPKKRMSSDNDDPLPSSHIKIPKREAGVNAKVTENIVSVDDYDLMVL